MFLHAHRQPASFRRVVASALMGAAIVGASAAISPSPAIASSRGARHDARELSALERAANRHQTYTTGTKAACYSYAYTDTTGDTTGGHDIAKYALSYDCAHNEWTASIDFAAAASSSQIGVVDFELDTDLDHNNTCSGAEQYLILRWSTNSNQLIGGIVDYTDSNCNISVVAAGVVQRLGDSKHVELTVPGSAVGASTFDWYAITGPESFTSSSQLDFAPNGTAWKSVKPDDDGGAFTASSTPPGINGVYTTLVPGDFNNDTYGDILFYAAGAAADSIWFGSASGTFTKSPFTINGVYRIIPGDYNGDGRSDLLFYAPGGKPDYVWTFNGGTSYTSTAFPINGTYPDVVPGDYNGDTYTDLLFYQPGTANDYMWLAVAGPSVSFDRGSTTINGVYSITAGNFDGTGADELFLYAPGPANDFVLTTTGVGRTFATTQRNVNGVYKKMIVGDYNGDARDDVLFFSSGVSPDGLLRGTSAATLLASGPTININEDYTSAVSGDFNGDTISDVLFYFAGGFPEALWSGV